MTKREFEKLIKKVSFGLIPSKEDQGEICDWDRFTNSVSQNLWLHFSLKVQEIFDELMKKDFQVSQSCYWLSKCSLGSKGKRVHLGQFYRLMVLGEFREQVIERKLYLKF